MTSAMTTAAAYERWLQIPPAQQPPHHYALLGLPLLAGDQQAVFHAYQQRAAIVGQHLHGPHAQLALQVLGELAAAQACLLSAESRAAYDRALQQRGSLATAAAGIAGVQRPAPRGKAAPPAAWPLGASAAATDAATPPPVADRGHEEPSSALPWLIGGVCAGLLAVAVLGVALFGWQRSAPRQSVVARAAAQGEHARGKANRRDREQIRRAPRDDDRADDGALIAKMRDDVLGERVAPLTTRPEPLDGSLIGPPDDETAGAGDVVISGADGASPTGAPPTGSPSSTPDDSSAPPAGAPPDSAETPAALPRAIALPSRAAGGNGLLAQLPVQDSTSVQLALDAAGVAGGGQFALGEAIAGLNPGERVWPVVETSNRAAPRDVGEYSLAGDELSFRWADTAQPSDEALANLALAVSLDGRDAQINQRSAEMAAPLRLSVDSGAITTSAKIEAPPPSARLNLSLAHQNEAFPAYTLQPEEPVAAGEEVDVIFGEAIDPYRLALRVALVDNGVGGVRIEARPMFQTADQGLKWDYFRPKAVLQTLAQLKQQESLLDVQLQQLQLRYGRNPLQLQQATEIYNRQATELQTRIAALEKIHALCEELNAGGALNYRVFAQVGERQVDLLDSTLGVSVPAGGPANEEDGPAAIVGPPTAP